MAHFKASDAQVGIGRWLTRLGVFSAHPAAFGLLAAFAAAWMAFGWGNLDWADAAALATLFMTLLIQRAEHRDTLAIHAKLDELLRTSGDARNELVRLDEQEPESIERHRERERDADES